MAQTARLILGDQLNSHHSWYQQVNPNYLYIMIECRGEGSYAPHHLQKVVGIFSAMRQFAQSLESKGHDLYYNRILDSRIDGLQEVLESICVQKGIDSIEIQQPDEWRVQENILKLRNKGFKLSVASSEHFISEPSDFESTFSGKKTFVMETFYRKLRKREGILMDAGQPTGGTWNLDTKNRKKLPKGHHVPPAYLPCTDVSEILHEVLQADLPTIGTLEDPKEFIWPTTREQALNVFEHWLDYGYPLFGDYQDAMTTQSWSLYHSRISFALNIKLINPKEICHRAEQRFREDAGIPLNAAEGFIRQILGWREFMRGVYWFRMPQFATENFFEHKRSLPQWFWTGETNMKCQSHAIKQSLTYSYAHHIQRLMVTGNFALLAGIHPDEVDQWYLGIYIDAFEWVEITNTRGMSQYADGGWIATKPYAASANYMSKMGDYCEQCVYNPRTKLEKDSCPLNTLYWDFFDRNRDKLGSNFRLGMVYRTYDKMSPELKSGIRTKAAQVLNSIEQI